MSIRGKRTRFVPLHAAAENGGLEAIGKVAQPALTASGKPLLDAAAVRDCRDTIKLR